MNRSDTASGCGSGTVCIEFDAILFCRCSFGELVERPSCANAWIDDARGSGREIQEGPQALPSSGGRG